MRRNRGDAHNACQGVGAEGTCQDRDQDIAGLATSGNQIRFLGQSLIQAYQSGDRQAAIRHQQAMVSAIKTQAESVKAARLREIDAAIAASDGCFFMDAGDRDRARIGGSQ